MALLLVLSSIVYGGSVHKWVDEKGVTHYSDQAPEKDTLQVDQLEVTDVYQTNNAEDDYYSASNQWARMHAERIERKKLQLEKAKLKQSKINATPQVVYVEPENATRSGIYYPAFANGFRNRNFRRFNGNRGRINNFNSGFRFRSSRNNFSRSGLGLTLTIR